MVVRRRFGDLPGRGVSSTSYRGDQMIDWGRWKDDAHRENVLLGSWFRARHSQGYRRREERQLGTSVDPETGYEYQEDLLAPGLAVRGPEFVMSCPVMPDVIAQNILLRDETDGTTTPLADARAVGIQLEQDDKSQPALILPGQPPIPSKKLVLVCVKKKGERAAVESEWERLCRRHPEWKPAIRELCGREAWDEDEASAVAELTYLLQRTMMDFARKGWLRLEPPLAFVSAEGDHHNRDLYRRGVGDNGLPWVATVTIEGLDEAERRIPGTALARGPFWGLSASSGEKKARAMANSPWAIERAKTDAAGGV